MRFHIPLHLPSLANVRMHWRKMTRVKKNQRIVVWAVMKDLLTPRLPLVIVITRIGPRRLDDDNLQSACKYVRDEIARKVGVDDGSDQYTWQYDQRIGEYGVEVEMTTRGDGS
jgi:hypothetical protein